MYIYKISTRVVFCVNVKLPQSAKIPLWTALEHSIITEFIYLSTYLFKYLFFIHLFFVYLIEFYYFVVNISRNSIFYYFSTSIKEFRKIFANNN